MKTINIKKGWYLHYNDNVLNVIEVNKKVLPKTLDKDKNYIGLLKTQDFKTYNKSPLFGYTFDKCFDLLPIVINSDKDFKFSDEKFYELNKILNNENTIFINKFIADVDINFDEQIEQRREEIKTL